MYIPYWYHESSSSFLSTDSNNLQAIYKKHVDTIESKTNDAKDTMANIVGLEEANKICEFLSEQKNLQALITGTAGQNLSSTEQAVWNLSQASRGTDLVAIIIDKSKTIAEVANEYCTAVNDMLKSFKNDGFQLAVQEEIKQEAAKAKSEGKDFDSKDRAAAISKAMDEWYATHDGDFINSDSSLRGQYASLSDYLARLEQRVNQIQDKISELGGASDTEKKDAENDIKKWMWAANSLKYSIQGMSLELATATGFKVATAIGAQCCVSATGQEGDKETNIDKKLKQESKSKEFAGRISKPDCVIRYSNVNYTVTYGVTIKNISFKFVDKANGKVRGKVSLSNGSNLYTLMIQDIGYTENELDKIYNLLSGHFDSSKKGDLQKHLSAEKRGKTEDSSGMQVQFDSLKQILKAQAFYSALTGFANNNDKRVGSLLMVVNGKLFPIQQVLEKVSDNGSNDEGHRYKDVSLSFSGNGWNRKRFTDQNVFLNSKDENNQNEKYARSTRTKQGVEKTLKTTKYRLSLDKQVIWDILSKI